MKPHQLAGLLNISPVTLRQWARKDYREFLQPAAQGGSGADRSYSDHDARVLAWVASLKTQNMPSAEISSILRAAQANEWRDLPPLRGMASDQPIAVVPREAVEERVTALQQRYELQLQAVIKERDELKAQLEAVRLETAAERLDKSALQKRLDELIEREAQLRGRLEQYTFGGHRINAALLVVTALLLGIVITLIMVVLLSHR